MYKKESLSLMCKILVRVGAFGILFKIMNWPFAYGLMCIGFIGAATFFGVLQMVKRKEKNENQ